MAQLHGKGCLAVGGRYRNESPSGTIFDGCVEDEVAIGSFAGIRPSLGAWAHILGHNTIFVDDRDPLFTGFEIG